MLINTIISKIFINKKKYDYSRYGMTKLISIKKLGSELDLFLEQVRVQLINVIDRVWQLEGSQAAVCS